MQQVGQRRNENGADSLAGKYRLIAELGQGGMATVYLAVMMGNSGFRKLAVVKLLRRELAEDADLVQMFLDEAKLCARLSHPNIVHTYDVGVDEFGHFMAMEYLDGVSMHSAISRTRKSGNPLKAPVLARVLLDVLEALHYAHNLKDYDGRSLSIVHRDVTPQNIFVTYDGQVKLLDFGIAKAATSSTHTATGVIKGKLTYMPPEQARGEAVDSRADLYGVGVMLWEAIAGRRRWPGGLSEPALYARLAAGEPPENPGGAAQGYPPALDALVLKALAPEPRDRFQTAADFRDALAAILREVEPVSLRDVGTTLASAFGEGRERLRTVIEEQFRVIDAGGTPSEPSQIPALASPGHVTGSQSFDRPAYGNDTAARAARTLRPAGTGAKRRPTPSAPAEQPASEGTHRPTEATAVPPPAHRSWFSRGNPGARRAIVAAAAVAVVIAAVAMATTRRSPPAEVPAPEVSVVGNGLAQGAAPFVAETPHADDPAKTAHPTEARASAQEASQRASAARRSEARAHATTAAPRASTPAVPVEPSVASAAASATAAEATGGSPPFRTPQTKPKVQLERDSPWP